MSKKMHTSTLPQITSPLRISTRSCSLSPKSPASLSPRSSSDATIFQKYDPVSPVQQIHEQRAKSLRSTSLPRQSLNPSVLIKSEARKLDSDAMDEDIENRPPGGNLEAHAKSEKATMSSFARMRQNMMEVANESARQKPQPPPRHSLRQKSSVTSALLNHHNEQSADHRMKLLNSLKSQQNVLGGPNSFC